MFNFDFRRKAEIGNIWHLLLLLLALALIVFGFIQNRNWFNLGGLFPTPSVAANSITLGKDGAVTGKSEPGAWVCIADANGNEKASVLADANGNFSIPVPAGLAAGAYKIVAAPASNAWVTSSAVDLAVADAPAVAVAPAATATAAPAAPTATAPPAATATSAPTATAPPAATATSAPTATAPPAATATAEPAAPALPAVTSLSGAIVAACDVKELSGTAAASVDVEIFDGEVSLGKAKTDDAGKWTLALSKCLPNGDRNITVKSDAGTSEPAKVCAVLAPVIAQPRGAQISRELPLSGTASNTCGSVVVKTADGKEVCTVTPTDGKWSCTLPADLAVDKQTISVSVVDAGATVVEGNKVDVEFSPLLPETGGN
jgi:large repetitive protein